MFSLFDVDRDGLITKAEAIEGYKKLNPEWTQEGLDAFVTNVFDATDADKDGKVSKHELREAIRAMHEQTQSDSLVQMGIKLKQNRSECNDITDDIFRRNDTNNSGVITKAAVMESFDKEHPNDERRGHFKEMVDQLDTENKGITKAALSDFLCSLSRPTFLQMKNKKGKVFKKQEEDTTVEGQVDRLWKDCDANQDAKLDTTELRNCHARLHPDATQEQKDEFNRVMRDVDNNHHGMVSREMLRDYFLHANVQESFVQLLTKTKQADEDDDDDKITVTAKTTDSNTPKAQESIKEQAKHLVDQVFANADKNNSGNLTFAEAFNSYMKINPDAKKEDLHSFRDHFADADIDGDGNVSSKELNTYFIKKLVSAQTGTSFLQKSFGMDAEMLSPDNLAKSAARDIFDKYDENHSGKISSAQGLESLLNYDGPVTDGDFKNYQKEFITAGNNKGKEVTFDKLVNFLTVLYKRDYGNDGDVKDHMHEL